MKECLCFGIRQSEKPEQQGKQLQNIVALMVLIIIIIIMLISGHFSAKYFWECKQHLIISLYVVFLNSLTLSLTLSFFITLVVCGR